MDLRTGIRRLHRRDDYLTRLAGVVDGKDVGLRYDSNATCPTWETCVTEWFVQDARSRATDRDTIRAVQQRAVLAEWANLRARVRDLVRPQRSEWEGGL